MPHLRFLHNHIKEIILSIDCELFMREKLTALYPFSALLIGLFLTQIVATVQVYLSNLALYDSLLAIKDTGYLTVPFGPVMSSLRNIGPALFGGLFFTFSIGTAIVFFTLALAWIWNRLLYGSHYLLYAYLILWLICLISINIHGFKFLLTFTLLSVPPVVFVFVSRCIANLSRHDRHPNDAIHVLPVIMLALLLGWQVDSRMFTDFRDIYLLSNPIGAGINNFYYKYTLYPAEVFKSLNQKMLKTAAINAVANNTNVIFERILLKHDYIPVERDTDVDLNIVAAEDDLIMENRGKPVLRISSQALLADPDKVIKAFEKQSDSDSLFRQLTFVSLLCAFPLAIYVLAHGFISIAAGLFVSSRWASIIASTLCFILCIILLFAFQFSRERDVSISNLPEALRSQDWQTRVSALKFIEEKGLEISQFKFYPELLTSALIVERYWLVRALGNSQNPDTYKDLLHFFNDPHPNIVTMALYAIGKRGQRDVIDEIMQLIKTTDNWYVQWYAYRALRSIGWQQTKSKQAP